MNNTKPIFNLVTEAIAAIAAGEMVVVVDDDDRENEGDLIMAASKATRETVAFMIRHTSGILCTPVVGEIADRLQLNLMVADNEAPMGTAFTVSIDYKHGLATGISADERATTAQALTNVSAEADDFLRPGHMFPLIAREGGVLTRSGHTEAAVDLATLAGLPAVGLLSELVNDDGSVQRLPGLSSFANRHGLKIISIADLIAYRQQHEVLVHLVDDSQIETRIGAADAYTFITKFDNEEFFALVFGEVKTQAPVTVCVHKDQLAADVFNAVSTEGSLNAQLERISQAKAGILIYQRCKNLQESSGRTTETSRDEERRQKWLREGVAKQILAHLEVQYYQLDGQSSGQQETSDLF